MMWTSVGSKKLAESLCWACLVESRGEVGDMLLLI